MGSKLYRNEKDAYFATAIQILQILIENCSTAKDEDSTLKMVNRLLELRRAK